MKAQVKLSVVNPADGPFQYHDMAMSKDEPIAIAGRLLKRLHNALMAGIEEEVHRAPGGLIAGDLIEAGTTVACNIICEVVQFAARPRANREGLRAAHLAVANEFEHQAAALALGLHATAARYRELAAETK